MGCCFSEGKKPCNTLEMEEICNVASCLLGKACVVAWIKKYTFGIDIKKLQCIADFAENVEKNIEPGKGGGKMNRAREQGPESWE